MEKRIELIAFFFVFAILNTICLSKNSNINYKYEIKHFTVPLDHFGFSYANKTFQIRYAVNDTFWRDDGPIFFYTGNEGAIELFIENTGFIWDIADQFGALIVFAEHRYYGESLPFGNESFSNPINRGFLSSSQALADFVDLITSLQAESSNSGVKRRYPVIAFGGSYGGMLASWLRMKYPHAVDGAIAASAPILQFTGITPCETFNRIVTSNYAVIPECEKNIRKSWKQIRSITATDEGKAWLTNEWKLCKQLKTNGDINALINWLTDIYVNLAMANYPYAANFLAPLPPWPVRAVCQHLKNNTLSDKPLLHAIYEAFSVYTNYTRKTKCNDINYSTTSQLGTSVWDYQSCTEMVMPICAEGVHDMFEKQPWNFTSITEECYKVWGVKPLADLVVKEYGGKLISASSNIVFSNGLLDPWSAGGVINNMSNSILAILIPDGAHHLDLRASNPNDPESVKQARQYHIKSIKRWIHEFHQKFVG